MFRRILPIVKELRAHAPFTAVGALAGLALMAVLLSAQVSFETSTRLFWFLHPAHVLLSAMATTALFRLHGGRGVGRTLWIGYLGAVGIGTLSDSLLYQRYCLPVALHAPVPHGCLRCGERRKRGFLVGADIRITVLVDNTVAIPAVRGEHGLAFWIDTGTRRLLFDTGQGLTLLDNARALRIDLESVHTIVLSHGHYDHAGGLTAFASRVDGPVTVHAHPEALMPKYGGSTTAARAIGLPETPGLDRGGIAPVPTRPFDTVTLYRDARHDRTWGGLPRNFSAWRRGKPLELLEGDWKMKTVNPAGCPTMPDNLDEFLEQQALAERMQPIRHKILVMSGKGGVGKSTVAVNLALGLVLAGKKVGLLDVDIHGPSIPKLLKLEDATIQMREHAMVPIAKAGIQVMSIGFLLRERDDAVIWRGPMKMGVIKQFLKDVLWGALDYLIIDSPPERERRTGTMKIAIPVAEGKLCLHFGHCEQFALLEADEKTRTILGKQMLTPPPHEPGVLPRWLQEQGADIIIAGGMGQRAQALFRESGIRVIVGAAGELLEDLAAQYLAGTLASGRNLCDH